MFRYLMDNAIASKDALSLSLGVSLTSEQVAALTHDIVWMEEREVRGETVLVPALYMAQAQGRLAPSGALIQGHDIVLISGEELNNIKRRYFKRQLKKLRRYRYHRRLNSRRLRQMDWHANRR